MVVNYSLCVNREPVDEVDSTFFIWYIGWLLHELHNGITRMRISEERVEIIAELIVNELEGDKFIELDGDREDILILIEDAIFNDLAVEDNLDDEIRALLRDYETEMDKQNIPYHQMFKMIKTKLVKERNLIL